MDALAALRLQIEWGADEVIGDTPVDRTRPAQVQAPALRPAVRPASHPATDDRRPATVIARARAAARAAETTEALRAALAAFADCPLQATATNLVFADGNPDAGLVLVGEVPDAEDDRSGRPFADRDGQLLDGMMASIGLDRTQTLLTCLVPWRPPGMRPVTEAEVAMCTPFLLRHLALLRPRAIVTFGQLPARALTGKADTIRRLRGRWHDTSIEGLDAKIPVLPMLHPRTLFNTPLSKREAWADMLTLRQHLDSW